MEKGDRTQIHNMIKEIFNTIASTTIDQDGKKLIKCTKRNKKSKQFIRLIRIQSKI